MTCSTIFHLCPRSAEDVGFSVLDRETGRETRARSEADARQIAECNYPGCAFALSTITSTHPGASKPAGAPDAVVVAILRPLGNHRFGVLAYVVSSVETAACIPFSQEVWPDLKDHLPHDQRRPAGRPS